MDITSGLRAAGTDGNSAIVLNLARSLAELAQAGDIDLKLYAPAHADIAGVNPFWVEPIPNLPFCSAEHRRVRYGLSARLLSKPPDVFLNVATGYQPRLHRTRQISIVYDLAFEIDEWKPYYTRELAGYLRENTLTAAQNADMLVAISQNTATDLQRLFKVSAERIRVIHCGYDRQRFRPESTDADANLRRVTAAGPFFLAVGTIQPRKNYDLLIRAFLRFRARHGPSHRLIIVGSQGWLSQSTVELAQRHAADGVVLWGMAESADIPALMRAATALVFPALYEGFGIPVVEAMACGTPVIASNTGPLPEVAGGAALLFDPRSEDDLCAAMIEVASRPQRRAELSACSLRRAQDFSWSKAARQYVDCAHQVAGR